ncbi:MAG: prolipoprotein diacylglyceryl transferase [Actinomycetota bacterium]|nr:prolipoprotein diacylglyceryl transferase [Actinomycetota bacterium]
MRPIPIEFHIGPLAVHTYGLGLAVTFWFGYRYFAYRLRKAGYPDRWLGGTFVWIIVTAIVGARAVHVLANLSDYTADPLTIFAIWQGGLSSFGGLALAIPTGLLSARRRCPTLRAAIAADLVTPVLVASWALGRLLGPQLMVAGGGKPTHQWFGMYYAGEVGRRLPVPIFQALECAAVFGVLMLLEHHLEEAARPTGLVTAIGVGLWGLSRFFDEFLWLSHDAGSLPIEVGGLVLFGLGAGVALWRLLAARGAKRPPATDQDGDAETPLSLGSRT